jgi:hypothetical protein
MLTALLVAAGLMATAGGCGTFAQSYPPAGVDELTIPTPSPDPSEFTSRIDNPWVAFGPGQRRIYDVTGGSMPGATRTVEVLPGHVAVAGVATTAVRTTLTPPSPAGAAPGTSAQVWTDYYAQDERGNVWWFGHQGATASWRAGVGGAQAGLAMAARPRTADGYRPAYVPGVVQDVATVVRAEGRRLQVDLTSELEPGGVVRETFERGVGLLTRLDAVTGELDRLRR